VIIRFFVNSWHCDTSLFRAGTVSFLSSVSRGSAADVSTFLVFKYKRDMSVCLQTLTSFAMNLQYREFMHFSFFDSFLLQHFLFSLSALKDKYIFLPVGLVNKNRDHRTFTVLKSKTIDSVNWAFQITGIVGFLNFAVFLNYSRIIWKFLELA
jgi:hypothetical protein